MIIKSKSYHLDIQTHGKNPYGLLRNSYREDGKVKKETLCRFTGLSLEQLRMMQAAIQGKTVMKDDFKILSSREYGASHVCVSILKELGHTFSYIPGMGEIGYGHDSWTYYFRWK